MIFHWKFDETRQVLTSPAGYSIRVREIAQRLQDDLVLPVRPWRAVVRLGNSRQSAQRPGTPSRARLRQGSENNPHT